MNIEAQPDHDIARPLRAWGETLFITALLPAIGWITDRRDPFFLDGVPWIMCAPMLIGLQHGARHGLASGLALLGGAAAWWLAAAGALLSFPPGHAVIVGLVGAVAGEYRDTWLRALQAAQRDRDTRAQELARLTSAYHLLQSSHGELEERVARSGPSLDTALRRVQAELGRAARPALSTVGDSILHVLGAHAGVQVASLHAAEARTGRAGGPRWQVSARPLACLGPVQEVHVDHPLVHDALERGAVTSVRETLDAASGSAPLLCVPLTDAGGHSHGVVLVHAMPFLALCDERLHLLAAMGRRVGGWLSDALRDQDRAHELRVPARQPRPALGRRRATITIPPLAAPRPVNAAPLLSSSSPSITPPAVVNAPHLSSSSCPSITPPPPEPSVPA